MKFAKKAALLIALLTTLALTSCSLIPKTVEFGQRKVKDVPTADDRPVLEERRRQAAQFEAEKINEARVAAARTSADDSVQKPLAEVAPVATALTISLGAPSTPWTHLGEQLAEDLNHQQARLDRAVDKYAHNVQKDVGKKIEGTGFIQMPYFVYLGCVTGFFWLLWIAWGIYGRINPAVGLARAVSDRVAGGAIKQLIAGGNSFLTSLKTSKKETFSTDEVVALFKQSHRQEQDAHVQDVVKSLLEK